MRRNRIAIAGALLGAAIVGSVATITLGGGKSTATSQAPPPVTTAKVIRTNLVTTALTEGTLGYVPTNPVINRLAGTYTALPEPGATLRPGEALYHVDNLPVVLMSGAIPAYRDFALGMTDGPDVAQLETNLIALGDAQGLFTSATDHFNASTLTAVERWQSAIGLTANGQIVLGQVIFLPGPVLIGAANAAIGQPASPGDVPFQVTTATRAVVVPLNPNLPTVSVGESVSIVLPTDISTPGRIIAIAPAPPTGSSGSNQSGGSGSSNSDQSQASTIATVTPDQPSATGTGAGIAVQVSLTTQSATNVLAVPIAALLALAGGSYGVEVVDPSGAHHLVGVTTGIFTGSQVEITGSDTRAGTKVVVAQ